VPIQTVGLDLLQSPFVRDRAYWFLLLWLFPGGIFAGRIFLAIAAKASFYFFFCPWAAVGIHKLHINFQISLSFSIHRSSNESLFLSLHLSLVRFFFFFLVWDQRVVVVSRTQKVSEYVFVSLSSDLVSPSPTLGCRASPTSPLRSVDSPHSWHLSLCCTMLSTVHSILPPASLWKVLFMARRGTWGWNSRWFLALPTAAGSWSTRVRFDYNLIYLQSC